jgi:formate hydrogenlyase subunit 3/multisubunit Na+/H+ antiporter MnhD subunit
VPARAFFGKPPEDAHHAEGTKEAPWQSLVAIMITALITLGLFINPGPFYELMTLVVSP